jgi:hypothetical protein
MTIFQGLDRATPVEHPPPFLEDLGDDDLPRAGQSHIGLADEQDLRNGKQGVSACEETCLWTFAYHAVGWHAA